MAQGLASLGRGGDSMLVHMSPSEVGALNKIAMATGGQLTRNPHTGLYEAGWLSSLLPMLAGGVATLFTGGMAAPLLAGAVTGAFTGDKKMPLWARLGLGALGGYGGAGLAGSLIGGATQAGTQAAAEGLKTAAESGATNLGEAAAATGADTSGIAGALGQDTAELAQTPLSSVADAAQAAPGAAEGVEGIAQIPGFGPVDIMPPSGAVTGAEEGVNGAAWAGPEAKAAMAQAAAAPPTPVFNTASPQLYLPEINSAGRVTGQMLAGADGTLAAPVSNSQLLAQGIRGLGTEQGRNAVMANLGKTAFGAKGIAAASAAPFLMNPQETLKSDQQQPWYYTAAPGQGSLYNPGVVNPNIAKLGYLPAGQSAFIGQQWNPGVFTHTFPGMPQEPSQTIGAKKGGLMGLRHFDQGGVTTPAPSMSNTLSNMNDYYKNMLGNASSQNAMTPTITTPPPDAMNAYLARATQMVTPQPYSQLTVADVTPATPNNPIPAKGIPADGSAWLNAIRNFGGMGGMSPYTNPDTHTTTTYPSYSYDPQTGQYTQTGGGERGWAAGIHMAQGGLADLTPNYAAGGKLLHGHGDGMSDSIPAVITGHKPQRAALADGEFVVPADVVSHLGNGSTNAGAKRLYAMMDKVRRARTGNPKQGKQINPDKFMPA
jgi:hypothetical protein